jgi:hypothetical protein
VQGGYGPGHSASFGELAEELACEVLGEPSWLCFTHVREAEPKKGTRPMITRTRPPRASSRRSRRDHHGVALEVAALEDRRLLSMGDLTTTATVATIKNGVATIQPTMATYATNAESVKVSFTTNDPDDPATAPSTHFDLTDTRTGVDLIEN